MNQRGKRTPPRLATAIVITTGSVMRPRNALGKPSTEACQEPATVPQLMTALMLQPRSAFGFSASWSASTARTKEATRLAADATSIVTHTVTLLCRNRSNLELSGLAGARRSVSLVTVPAADSIASVRSPTRVGVALEDLAVDRDRRGALDAGVGTPPSVTAATHCSKVASVNRSTTSAGTPASVAIAAISLVAEPLRALLRLVRVERAVEGPGEVGGAVDDGGERVGRRAWSSGCPRTARRGTRSGAARSARRPRSSAGRARRR